MKWEKKGLVYVPDGSLPWAAHSALQPTPYLMGDVIRMYVGFREGLQSRVGFVDLDANDPLRVLGVSKHPVLDIGSPGTFDENGVVPCAVVRPELPGSPYELHLYYAGYQLGIGAHVRFFAFGGLAISRDGGNSFTRYSKVPVLERSERELFFRVIHSLRFEDGTWKVWYGAGSKFIGGNSHTLPVYDIRYLESKDGIHFGSMGTLCIGIEGEGRGNEHRVGRPHVIKEDGVYKMFYSKGAKLEGYRLGYAESEDGVNWTRKDGELGLDVSERGWDSQMMAYPSIVKHKGKTYLFYNGNENGRTGFGFAVLRV